MIARPRIGCRAQGQRAMMAYTCVRLSACLHEVRKSFIRRTIVRRCHEDFSALICTEEGEARHYVGRELVHETHVRAHLAHPSATPLWQRLNVIMTRWHWLIQIARNPYRPELHYMRGPGPKWCAKHQAAPKMPRFEGEAAQSSSRKRH